VKDLNIQPSEAWGMDFKEIRVLTGLEDEVSQDISLMLNYERKQNDCPKSLLTSTIYGGE
jgi:hypothetical protein